VWRRDRRKREQEGKRVGQKEGWERTGKRWDER